MSGGNPNKCPLKYLLVRHIIGIWRMNKRFPKLFKITTLGHSCYFQRNCMTTSKVLWPSHSISRHFSKKIFRNCKSAQRYNVHHNMAYNKKNWSNLNVQKWGVGCINYNNSIEAYTSTDSYVVPNVFYLCEITFLYTNN